MSESILGYAAMDDARRLGGPTFAIGRRVVAALVPAGLSAAAFHRHVVASCRDAAFLPARIGLTVDARWQSQSSVNEDKIADAIAALGRRIELAVTVQLPPAAPIDGRRYLAARTAEQDTLSACDATLEEVARRHFGQVRTTRRARGLEGVLLLSRAEVSAAVADLEQAARARHSDVTIAVSGPWPPYRFAAVALPELA